MRHQEVAAKICRAFAVPVPSFYEDEPGWPIHDSGSDFVYTFSLPIPWRSSNRPKHVKADFAVCTIYITPLQNRIRFFSANGISYVDFGIENDKIYLAGGTTDKTTELAECMIKHLTFLDYDVSLLEENLGIVISQHERLEWHKQKQELK